MKRLFLPLAALFFITRAGAQITAVTEEGKTVMLFSNGTWRYLNDSVRISYTGINRFSIPETSTQVLQDKDTCYSIWVDPKKWQLLPDTLYKNADFSFESHDGEVIAMIIREKIQLPLKKIKAAAIESFTKTGTEFKITEEQKIVVNGTEGLLLKIDALVDDIPFAYLNTYFSTNAGTFQLITFTGYNLFDRYRNLMTELISGFVIHKP
ncbi:MAG: hypothetical protein JXR41_11910 [Bacteroidales bacterium]|nr:hypothetical protein [Bacteroidales bacterium]MBN2763789.1 hypothetical protein [Bacteroidales bacterium]